MNANNDSRPDPDLLLELANAEADAGLVAKVKRAGRLKIFLGMCAGVGKTYTMLEHALAQQAEGRNVLVGYVETHSRPDTEKMLTGLSCLPRIKIGYRGIEISEFDLDGALKRNPDLIVVDELPHTNAPGSRNTKRLQDVLELLEAGIDVYTALNVQHVESRADAVAQITGVIVRETVPDSILERADDIELIDLSPEDLLKRLAEGKVYLGAARASSAAASFFRKGNLRALREMSLLITAEHVDRQMRDYMRVKKIAGPWQSTERLLVAIGEGVLSERLIRRARGLATSLDAPWFVVHVETRVARGANGIKGLAHNLTLARQLGAETITTTDEDVVSGILRVAQQNNITQIVVGRPIKSTVRRWLAGGTILDRLLERSKGISIHVVGSDGLKPETVSSWPALQFSAKTSYASALGIMSIAILLGAGLFNLLAVDYQVIALMFVFCIMMLSLRFSVGPVLVATILSAAALDFFFIAPFFTLLISSINDAIMFGFYFGISLVLGTLTSRLQNTSQLLRQRERQAVVAFEFSRSISQATSMSSICSYVIEKLGASFDAATILYLPDAHRKLHATQLDELGASEDMHSLGVATWVFEHGRPAGRFEETLPDSEASFFPLISGSGIVGVLSMALKERPSNQQIDSLKGLISQAALAIEREQLNVLAAQRNTLEESERLSRTLLGLISHELRTPIAAIHGAASSLIEANVDRDPEARKILYQSIHTSVSRLNQLIENLLDMTRLESGNLKLRSDWTDVVDLFTVVRQRISGSMLKHEFIVDIAPELPIVRMDMELIVQVLYNLLQNAVAYTQHGTRIRLRANRDGDWLVIEVLDRGPGLPQNDLVHIFDKFRRLDHPSGSGGLGLGLSICKGLVEAHGGVISAQNRHTGGLRMAIRLPIDPQPVLPGWQDV